MKTLSNSLGGDTSSNSHRATDKVAHSTVWSDRDRTHDWP